MTGTAAASAATEAASVTSRITARPPISAATAAIRSTRRAAQTTSKPSPREPARGGCTDPAAGTGDDRDRPRRSGGGWACAHEGILAVPGSGRGQPGQVGVRQHLRNCLHREWTARFGRCAARWRLPVGRRPKPLGVRWNDRASVRRKLVGRSPDRRETASALPPTRVPPSKCTPRYGGQNAGIPTDQVPGLRSSGSRC